MVAVVVNINSYFNRVGQVIKIARIFEIPVLAHKQHGGFSYGREQVDDDNIRQCYHEYVYVQDFDVEVQSAHITL
jgi:hypothetical protein